MKKRKKIFQYISSVPLCPELHRHLVPKTSDVGHMLCFFGTIVRTTAPKMLEYKKDMICTKCRHVFTIKADYDQYYQLARPSRCPNPEDCHSVNFNPVGVTNHPLHTKDYQEIKIQEQVQKLVVGNIPRSMWVTLEDDLVDSCKPGDDVLVCGVVLRRWSPVNKNMRPSIDLVMKANNVTVQNKQRSTAAVTDEMREEHHNFWEAYQFDPLNGRNHILSSFCPQVYGLYVVKLAVAVVIAGGVQKQDSSGTRIRGESHLLLVGDPGTGKSQFLKYVSNLVPRCVLTTGIGTTNAGLTVAAVKEGAEWALEAGALVLADGGVCCIDEFSSVKEADRAAIHEAMEQQTISVAKAGLVCKLNTRCTILAATNPKGQYDPEESLTVNVALASPLLSRFDLILVMLDTKNPDWDRIVSTYILEGKDPLEENATSNNSWNLEQLQAYFLHIRSFHPKMTPQANVILARYYQLQRQTDNGNQARTTIRLLESLVRLSQGHARLLMHTEVKTVDAVVAVTLMEASMCGASLIAGINPLHTAFPRVPREEYRHQAQVVLEKLGLGDILKEEIMRLDEEESLHKNSSNNSTPNWNSKEVSTKGRNHRWSSTTQQKNSGDLQTCVNVVEAVSLDSEEHVPTQTDLHRTEKKQRKRVFVEELDDAFDFESGHNSGRNKKNETGTKKKTQDKCNGNIRASKSSTNKRLKKSEVGISASISASQSISQLHIEKSGNSLLEELEDFEEDSQNTLKSHKSIETNKILASHSERKPLSQTIMRLGIKHEFSGNSVTFPKEDKAVNECDVLEDLGDIAGCGTAHRTSLGIDSSLVSQTGNNKIKKSSSFATNQITNVDSTKSACTPVSSTCTPTSSTCTPASSKKISPKTLNALRKFAKTEDTYENNCVATPSRCVRENETEGPMRESEERHSPGSCDRNVTDSQDLFGDDIQECSKQMQNNTEKNPDEANRKEKPELKSLTKFRKNFMSSSNGFEKSKKIEHNNTETSVVPSQNLELISKESSVSESPKAVDTNGVIKQKISTTIPESQKPKTHRFVLSCKRPVFSSPQNVSSHALNGRPRFVTDSPELDDEDFDLGI
ncbi:DNA helicase MCM9-like isoform X2 [Oratosquilla oratoria]|uniref:DNA helicase MCM9-like isoform X2 n=1 Tax=Oratosquilla oratoria TaxID=337810 RepID=UPI003F772165